MDLVVAAPRAVSVADEGCHPSDESTWRRDRELGHEDPLVISPDLGGGLAPGAAPRQVAQVDGHDAAGAKGAGDGHEGSVDCRFVVEVAQHVADRDNGVGRRDSVVGEAELADVSCMGCVSACQVEH